MDETVFSLGSEPATANSATTGHGVGLGSGNPYLPRYIRRPSMN